MKTKQSMTLRTLAMVAALWLACAASALAQTNIYNGTRDGGEQPSTGENNGGNTGTDQPVDPGTGGGTGTDQPYVPGGGGSPGIQYTEQEIATAKALQDACKKESGNDEIFYKLTADITTSEKFSVKNCLHLDLNGYSITSSSYFCFIIEENATMTVADRSIGVHKGSINSSFDEVSDAIHISSGAKFIADGVSISFTNGNAIYNSDGTAEITGCTISGNVGIYNTGTTTVNGGSISGTITAIKNFDGTFCINACENPVACAISGGEWGIENQIGGTVTIGSDVSIANYTASGIQYPDGTVTLYAWPTFSAANVDGVTDIWLYQDKKIIIGKDIICAPSTKISVGIADSHGQLLTSDALPYTFTSGYASHVIDVSSNKLDPAEVFTYYNSNAGYAVALDASSSSEATLVVDPNFIPVGTDVTNDLSPTASGDFNVDWEFEMPDYDVLVYFVYEDLFDPVTFAFAEGQEWMTWCSEASFTKPDGIDAYTIADATPEAITVTPITASDASQPAVLPAYTPLLLRKNGYDGTPAEQYAVPTAPTDDLFKDYGIVSQATTDCTVYGSTKAVTDAASSQVFALGRTYMLKSGEFVAVDRFDGIAANRCWLTLSGTPAASRLLIRSGESTEVSGVIEVNEVSDNTWYTITGRKIEKRPDRKGIYINNGKKVIIK